MKSQTSIKVDFALAQRLRRALVRVVGFVIPGTFSTASLSSHPHVWVDARVDVTRESGVIQGL